MSEILKDTTLQHDKVLDDQKVLSILESILFFSDRPVTLESIQYAFEGTNVDLKKIKESLKEYSNFLLESNRGIYLEQIASGYQLRTKKENIDFLKKLKKTKAFRLTASSLEVLAIIAYEQPCIKARIDEVRSVDSGHLLRGLMDKGLVAFYGKSDLPGKPMLYKTTKKFLEVFGLKNLKQLPAMNEIDSLLPEGMLEEQNQQADQLPPLADLSQDLKKKSNSFDKNKEDYKETEQKLKKVTQELLKVQVPPLTS